ncbi:hypothetical protein C8R46DRAFT_237334 [Mycena filopes]|nr:hypothetical protein C8R46DRAFT_237334 [Mycena filopes]
MPRHRLPTEILERIMDALPDRRSVARCGLVSSEWTPRSRYLLFSTVHLGCSDFPTFLALLGSRKCTFASFVSTLCIDVGDDAASFHVLVTSAAFGRLGCVRSLQLSNIDWTALPLPEQRAIESNLTLRFSELTKLTLLRVSFHDLKSALQLASRFSRLKHLRLVELRFSKYLEHNIASARTQAIPVGWESVEIDGCEAIAAFLECICAQVTGIRASKLVNVDDSEEYVEFVRLVVGGCGLSVCPGSVCSSERKF